MTPGMFCSQKADKFAHLTPEEMDFADRKAIAGGISGADLMEAVGRGGAGVVTAR